MRLRPLGEQVVVVFGASTDLGRAAALQLARRGARLVLSAASHEGLDTLVGEIQAAGGRGIAIAADPSDHRAVEAVAEGAVTEFGRLDSWVHTAAAALHAPFADTTPEEFQRIVDVNLLGVVHGLMAALPRLRTAGGGALIVVSAVAGTQALPLTAAYSAAMHGVRGLLDALRMELHHDRAPISVTNIIPAVLDAAPGIHAGPAVADLQWVAQAIANAAERPQREIIVGGPAKAILKAKRYAPAMAEAFVSRASYASQTGYGPRPGRRTSSGQRSEAQPGAMGEGSTRAPFETRSEGFACPVCAWVKSSALGRAILSVALLAAGVCLVGALLRAREQQLEAQRRAASPLGRAKRLLAQAPRLAELIRLPLRRAARPQAVVGRLASAIPAGLHLARNASRPARTAWSIPLQAAPEIGAAVGDIAERFAGLSTALTGLADDLVARGQEALHRPRPSEADGEQEDHVVTEEESSDCS